MARSLLLLLLMISSLAARPANAQYLFMDTSGDSTCDVDDYVGLGLDTVWVWIDTNHDQIGSVVTCPTGEELTISDYELCLAVESYRTGHQPVTVGRWINKVPEFTDSLGFHVETSGVAKVHVYYSSNGATNHLPAGKRLLGGLEVTMTPYACNRVSVQSATQIGTASYETGFYSRCPGSAGDNRVRLGVDFIDNCVAGGLCSDVKATTWGRVKQRYR